VRPSARRPRAWLVGTIEAPPRANALGSAAILIIVAAIATLGPLREVASGWIIAASALGTLLALAARSAYGVHAGLLTLIYLGVMSALAPWWPFPLVVILGLYAVVVRSSTWLRASSGWLRRGQLDRTTWLLTAAFVSASAIALVIWRFRTNADLTSFRQYVPDVPLWTIPIGILLFAALNAAFEETIWRGVLMHALGAALGPGWAVWLLQGVAFGIWHYAGFPRGWVGVGLAILFALMMGWLRMRTRGMLAPFIGHFLADVTIYILVTVMVLGGLVCLIFANTLPTLAASASWLPMPPMCMNISQLS
jgi:membrane protease YdiL (CAAX protease family)